MERSDFILIGEMGTVAMPLLWWTSKIQKKDFLAGKSLIVDRPLYSAKTVE